MKYFRKRHVPVESMAAVYEEPEHGCKDLFRLSSLMCDGEMCDREKCQSCFGACQKYWSSEVVRPPPL